MIRIDGYISDILGSVKGPTFMDTTICIVAQACKLAAFSYKQTHQVPGTGCSGVIFGPTSYVQRASQTVSCLPMHNLVPISS